MSDPNETRLKLEVDSWMDSPMDVVDAIWHARSGPILIDAATDKPVGAQIAQLLLSAMKTVSDEGGSIQIVDASDEFTQSIQTLGLKSAFEKVIQ